MSQRSLLTNASQLDIFACHGISGMVGLFLTGIFAQASVANNDAITEIPGGWLDGNFIQLGYQMAWICFATAWTAAGTFIIMFVIDHIPGLHFRSDDEGELAGVDDTECGEVGTACCELDRYSMLMRSTASSATISLRTSETWKETT